MVIIKKENSGFREVQELEKPDKDISEAQSFPFPEVCKMLDAIMGDDAKWYAPQVIEGIATFLQVTDFPKDYVSVPGKEPTQQQINDACRTRIEEELSGFAWRVHYQRPDRVIDAVRGFTRENKKRIGIQGVFKIAQKFGYNRTTALPDGRAGVMKFLRNEGIELRWSVSHHTMMMRFITPNDDLDCPISLNKDWYSTMPTEAPELRRKESQPKDEEDKGIFVEEKSSQSYWDMDKPLEIDGHLALNDALIDKIQIRLGQYYIWIGNGKPCKYKDNDLLRYMADIARANPIDFFRAYLQTLEDKYDPEIDFSDHPMELFDFDDRHSEEYIKDVFKANGVGMVRRWDSPGCIHDWMPVLVGPKGNGKSLYFKMLLPPRFRVEWYSESASFDQFTPDEIITNTAGKGLVELQEMRGSNKQGTSVIKSGISTQVDHGRLRWEKYASDRPRQFIFVGTANEDEFGGILPNSPHERRFYPVLTKRKFKEGEETYKAFKKYFDEYGERLLAYFWHEYRNGHTGLVDSQWITQREQASDGLKNIPADVKPIADFLVEKFHSRETLVQSNEISVAVAKQFPNSEVDMSRPGSDPGKNAVYAELQAQGWRRDRSRWMTPFYTGNAKWS